MCCRRSRARKGSNAGRKLTNGLKLSWAIHHLIRSLKQEKIILKWRGCWERGVCWDQICMWRIRLCRAVCITSDEPTDWGLQPKMAQIEMSAGPSPDPAMWTLSSACKTKGSFLTPPTTPKPVWLVWAQSSFSWRSREQLQTSLGRKRKS